MTAYVFPTRRMLVRDMGKAGLALLVLGTAGCAMGESEFEEGPDATASPPDSLLAGSPPGFVWRRAHLGFVSAYILHRNSEAVLVDTGVAGNEADIGAALAEAGLEWGAVGHIVITHKHPDHQGSLPAVLGLAPEADWYAGTDDIPHIDAPKPPSPVGDGDRVLGLDIIGTPGHTPGHISVLDRAGGVLVSGDAMNGIDGGVGGANPGFSEDMDLANASVRKLAGFDYEVALFGHGEPLLTGASDAVRALALTL